MKVKVAATECDPPANALGIVVDTEACQVLRHVIAIIHPVATRRALERLPPRSSRGLVVVRMCIRLMAKAQVLLVGEVGCKPLRA